MCTYDYVVDILLCLYIHTLSNFQAEPRSTWADLLSTWPRPSQHGSIGLRESSHGQWEFQDPKLEVPTIYKAYIRAM